MSKFLLEIRRALRESMQEDNKIILLGEDIKDPFGGCFNVTRGLTNSFPGRVINTPISEAGIMGVANGLAIQGYKPIVEFMFFDFMTLTMDQILNHTIKFKQLWDLDMNITIRTVIGNPDYGVTHCQDLSYLYDKILTIFHPKNSEEAYPLLKSAIQLNKPVLFVEDSKLYGG